MNFDYFFDDNLQDRINYNFCKRKKKYCFAGLVVIKAFVLTD